MLLSSCNGTECSTLTIGHRGAMGHETENTLASIQKAIALGVAMIEIDVFKIRSGEIVVFHDKHVDRLTNGSGSIEEYDLAALQQLIVEGNHKIPLLQDVLTLINNQVALNIELKGTHTAESVYRIIKHYVEEKGWSWDNFLISSFRWNELRTMRKCDNSIKIAVLTEEDPLQALNVAKALNAVAINPNYTTLTKENTTKIHQEGFAIYTWTVNTPLAIEKVKGLGVNGIITNYPERLK